MPSLTGLPALGMNLNGYSYFQTSHPFTDVATQDYWRLCSGGTFVGGTLNLDSSGQVTSLLPGTSARKIVFTHNDGVYPTGQYRLEWQGSGSLNLGYYAFVSPFSAVSSGSNFTVYTVPGNTNSNGLSIEIATTNTGNPVRGVKLIPPFSGYVSGDVFTRPFLNSLTGYGVIRFMDFGMTNNNTIANWSDRVTLNHSDWGYTSRNGPPVEIQIDLCNKLNCDGWFCVPHLATNDYVAQLATLISGRLNSNLRAWVEYSNEVWNFQFTQANYVYTGLMPSYGLTSQTQAYGRRNGEIINIFKNICGTGGRVVGVLGGQAVNPTVLQNVLIGAVISGKQCGDVCAVAPYFGVSLDTLFSQYTGGTPSSDILTYAFTVMSGNVSPTGLTSSAYVTSNKIISDSYGLPLVCYEGGQHLTPAANSTQYNNTGFMNLLYNIHRDPRMSGTYYSYLNNIHGKGNYTFVHFNDCYPEGEDRFGQWGLTNHYLDFDAPKYKGYRAYSDNRISSGIATIPVTVLPVINNSANIAVTEGNSQVFTLSSYGLEPLSCSITSGTDQNKFTIDPTTRIISFTGILDYENPMDSDTNNIYNIGVRSTNINGISAHKSFNISVYNSLSDGAGVPLTSGLVLLLPLNDNAANTTVSALVGSGAILSGGHNTSDIITTGPNSAVPLGFNFDGISDYVAFSGVNTPTGIASSLEIYFKIDVRDNSNGDYILAGAGFSNTILLASPTQLNISVGSAGTRIFSVPPIGTGWNNLILTKDIDSSLRLYLNGTESPSGVQVGSLQTYALSRIGAGGTPVFADFQFARFSFWRNRLLTPSEVSVLYNSGQGFAYPWTPTFITSSSGFSIVENTTFVGNITTTGVTPTYSINGGNDASKFTITTGGALSFISPPDYEIPGDFDGNNQYDLTVQVANAAGPVLQDVRVTILDDPSDNLIPPSITNDDDVSITENNTIVIDLDASGSTPLTFTINGGADQALFGIDGNGILAFLSPPDYSVPLDANSDNIYEVQVLVYNTVGNDTILIYITVLDDGVIPPVDNGPQDIAFKINQDGEIHVSLGIVADGTPDGQTFDQIGTVDLTKLAKYVTRFHKRQL